MMVMDVLFFYSVFSVPSVVKAEYKNSNYYLKILFMINC